MIYQQENFVDMIYTGEDVISLKTKIEKVGIETNSEGDVINKVIPQFFFFVCSVNHSKGSGNLGRYLVYGWVD